MDAYRYHCIEKGRGDLTDREREEGWHFCPDWDFMLVNKNEGQEKDGCTCIGRRDDDKQQGEPV